MRTTIRLDEDLLRRAKRRALDTHRTLNAVIEDALRAALARGKARQVREAFHLPVSHGMGGVQPGVDLDNSAALLDLMEQGP